MSEQNKMGGLFGLASLLDPRLSAPASSFSSVPPGAQGGGLLGYMTRNNLYPGETDFYKSNPHIAGMATSLGDITLNPFSPPNVNHGAVAKNEAFRLYLSDLGKIPDYQVTPEQRSSFAGTAYGSNDDALKSTIAARIYSGDPSAKATDAQRNWVAALLSSRFIPK